MAQMQGEIKRNIASLVGGIAVGIVVFALGMLIARDVGQQGAVATVASLLAAAAIGFYIRLADL